MKVKSVEIVNMHKVSRKVYNLKDFNYAYGKNGAGKSTMLQAIQLGILGYIPGYGKRNMDIFKHSNSISMRVIVTLVEESGKLITLDRTFVKIKSQITSSLVVTPEGAWDEFMISDIELPIFNFSDFLSQSPNTMKTWFLNFIPPTEKSKVDVVTELQKASEPLSSTPGIKEYEDVVIKEYLKYTTNMRKKPIDAVKLLNSYLKDQLSAIKIKISDNQSTVNKLTFYDDVISDKTESEIRSEILSLRQRIQSAQDIKRARSKNKEVELQLQSYSEYTAETAYDDPSFVEVCNKIEEIRNNNKKLHEQMDALMIKRTEVDAQIKAKQDIIQSSGICPYTKTQCDSVVAIIEEMKADVENLTKELYTVEKEYQSIYDDYQKGLSEINKCKKTHAKILDTYSLIHMLKSKLVDVDMTSDPDFIIEDCSNQIELLESDLVKISANERYNSLINELTTEKFKLEIQQDLYKLWVKTTGPNELQSTLMKDPLSGFKDQMNIYLKQIFGDEVSCEFLMSEKSNSFSFGIKRGETYIPYELLSGGEKCMYMTAIMTCILKNSKSILDTVIVDDMLDHLDDENLSKVLQSLSNIDEIQYIFAGAHCPDKIAENINLIEI